MMKATLILSDSGGIQEEAPTLRKPVLVLRSETERPEGVDCGIARLVGTDQTVIVDAVTQLLTDTEVYNRMASVKNPYGDGKSAQRIGNVLRAYLGLAVIDPVAPLESFYG
jgi:UDP-N-acetylglucosamine 2-epimerase (non-hydrolysing)